MRLKFRLINSAPAVPEDGRGITIPEASTKAVTSTRARHWGCSGRIGRDCSAQSNFLTQGEHNALRDARDRLGWKSATSPFNWDPGTQKLGHVVQALRLIEEGTTEVSQLAEELNVRPRKVQQILARLDGVRPVSEVLAELAIERDSVDRRATAGHVRLGSADRPLEGRGLDEIGLFAYSCDEADDRIKLIDKALSDGAAGRDVEALHSARKKLDAWRKRLDQLQG